MFVKSLVQIRNNLIRINSKMRTFLLIIMDLFLLECSIIITVWISNLNYKYFIESLFWLSLILIPVSLIIYFLLGQYRGLTRYAGSKAFYRLLLRNAVLFLTLKLFLNALNFYNFGLKFWLNLWFFSTFLTGASRIILRDILFRKIFSRKINKVLIYGAGQAGAQLAASLSIRGGYKILNFVDDNNQLWGRTLDNIEILNPNQIPKKRDSIDQILLAIPSLSLKLRKELLEKLSVHCKPVLQIPSLDEITKGKNNISELRPITVDDLLGRDAVPPNEFLLGKSIINANICVTGAGGSIGSELCRQIISFNPKSLILIERSEADLYQINKELEFSLKPNINLFPILGSATDFNLVKKVLDEKKIDIVFHAAAYKHVPLVERNPIQGIYNNVISTKVLCKVSSLLKIKNFILISTDKAVRPTNIMGASKRLAELIVRKYSLGDKNTKFSIVRFGNVLGSSGSVVPLFQKQISDGGPLTLTHPDIIRYFMTIKEASQLVLQAASLSNGGDVFLLDMGAPVKIKFLAEQMIKLNGLKIKDADNPEGDIEILNTGLRPGEKLFEELLIEGNSQPTKHPLIYRAKEPSIENVNILDEVDELEICLKKYDKKNALKILLGLVPEWKPYLKFDK